MLQKEPILPEYKDDVNYNEEFWKKYLKNQINFAIIKELTEKIAELEKQMLDIDVSRSSYRISINSIKNCTKSRTVRKIEGQLSKLRKSLIAPMTTVIGYTVLTFL